MVHWNATREEHGLIAQIADRLEREFSGFAPPLDRLDLFMDLEAVHSNGCPLDFEKLLQSSRDDLLHDLQGIRKHLNRETGKLEGCFRPRCAMPVSSVESSEN